MCKPETLQDYLMHIEGLFDAATRVKLVVALEAQGLSRLDAEHELTRMSSSITSYYDGVHSDTCFLDQSGVIFDCIAQAEFPSARVTRALGYEILTSAPSPAPFPGKEKNAVTAPSDQGPCPPGNVAARRLTLEFLASFGTLERYFQKYPAQHEPDSSTE